MYCKKAGYKITQWSYPTDFYQLKLLHKPNTSCGFYLVMVVWYLYSGGIHFMDSIRGFCGYPLRDIMI